MQPNDLIDPPDSMRELVMDVYRRHSRPIQARPPEGAESRGQCPQVAAVFLDVYGTMVCSGVGDISLSEDQSEDGHFFDAVKESFADWESWVEQAKRSRFSPSQAYREIILEDHRQARVKGVPFPEVDIAVVWSRLLDEWSREAELETPTRPALMRAATVFECLSNPVWPYEGVFEFLASLRERGIPVGIVSNSQFYTPIMLEFFGGGRLEQLGIDTRISSWSYLERIGKPSSELFARAAARLMQHHGIDPSSALFIGNDMLKDMVASSQAGFRTALFAGDSRSLRLRREDRRCRDFEPDCVFTSWHGFRVP